MDILLRRYCGYRGTYCAFPVKMSIKVKFLFPTLTVKKKKKPDTKSLSRKRMKLDSHRLFFIACTGFRATAPRSPRAPPFLLHGRTEVLMVSTGTFKNFGMFLNVGHLDDTEVDGVELPLPPQARFLLGCGQPLPLPPHRSTVSPP